ncbi:MAG: SPOR domain-containing protein [Gammaproteobacteria bacterium]
MKEETRYRVTGSLFLLALAIIILPMILDGAGLPTVEPSPVAAPSAVDLDTAPLESDDDVAATAVRLTTEVSPDGFAESTDTRLGEPVLDETEDQSGPEQSAAVAAEPTAPAHSPEPEIDAHTEPRLAEANQPTGVWAIQVASFANVDNARVLRDRLRADGYEAFLSTLKTANGPSTRVAVGPMQNRAEAAALKDALSARYRVTARLMAFSI